MGAFQPAGFFVLRTPLLPMAVLFEEGPAVVSPPDRVSWEARAASAREVLAGVVARPEVREAIVVASPDLSDAVEEWTRDPLSDRGARAERALVRYAARMCTRPTPFGLFAGCTVGHLGDETSVQLGGVETHRRSTRLDMEYVAALVDALERDPEVRQRLTYRPNSSVYTAAGRVRYVEAVLRDRVRHHRLVAVDATDYLVDTLQRAARGATASELAGALVDDDVSLEDGAAFVDELIDAQLLVPDLEPPVTGADPVASLVDRLADVGGSAAVTAASVLGDAAAGIRALDALPLGTAPQRYREVAELLGALPARVDLPRLFQVDLTKPAVSATLGPPVMRELESAVRVLHALAAPPRNGALDTFRERFAARYEDAELPLEQALDEETGVGFEASAAPSAEASPLLRDLAFPAAGGDTSIPWSRTQTFLLRRLTQALRDGADQVVITPQDADGLAADDRPPLPAAFAVTASVAAPSPDALLRGEFRALVHSVVGPSGARMLGRFCHTDPELERRVRAHLASEAAAAPGAVIAEVVHLPEGRIGNILHRPVLREYEIPYLGRSGADPDRQIPVSDLMVSVRDNRVVLRARRLGREVLPRLSTAHNFVARSIGVYRFLCALQNQGVSGVLSFDWGMLATCAYLPRVVCGPIVLSRARWRLSSGDIGTLAVADAHARHLAMQALRERLRLPRIVVLSDADNELAVDLDNPLLVETLVHLLRRRSDAVLTELFPAPDELWVEGPEGRFAAEMIVPFEARTAAPAATVSHRPVPPAPVAHLPGSDWLYLKLYCGTSTADSLLRDVIGPLVRGAVAQGAVDRWFFIRYGDPDWHLRVRLHGHAEALTALLSGVRNTLTPLLTDASIARLAVDTYRPELHRYGGEAAMPLIEEIFAADSDAVLGIVELLSGDDGMDARWRLALRGADMLLDDLGLPWEQRRRVVRALRDGYRAEHRADGRLRGQIGERFRNERTALTELVRRSDDAGSPLAPGLDLLTERSVRIQPLAAQLRGMEEGGLLQQPLPAIAQSLVHMHANRLLRSAQRAQELVIYDFLDRIYTSMAERR